MNRKLSRNEIIKIRRKRQLKRRVVGSMLIALFILSFSGILFGIKSIASDGTHVEYYKYFKTVQVSSTDSILEIADEYANPEMTSVDRYIEEVLFINNIDSLESNISEKYIIIPYYDTLHS